MELKLTAAQVQDAIRAGLPSASKIVVEEVRSGYARVRLPFKPDMIRPGNRVSGPSLFNAADLAMYALVLAHIGPQLMAVTADLNIRFLYGAKPADIIAEAKLLRLGKRLAVMEVALFPASDPQMVAHAAGSYALPKQG